MHLRRLWSMLLAIGWLTPTVLVAQTHNTTTTLQVTLKNGTTVPVEAGELRVPESRRRPTARQITIPYYRLRSESRTPASPIFLLAGGPGSSWLDQFTLDETHREAVFYQTIADVVLFDQRGAGHATPKMTCPATAESIDAGTPLDLTAVGATMRRLVVSCRDQWLKDGIDLAAYNTVENASDVNDLRLALGYGKVTLVGGSYGSHLALQFMRQYPDAVDRVVLFGVNGPDHTWDSPSAMLATLERIASAAEQSAAFAGRIPEGGLLKMLGRVLQRLEVAPQIVTVAVGAESRRVVVNAARVRQMARANAGRRNAPSFWPEMILAMDRGDFSMVARRSLNQELRLPDPMHFSMDCSSGASEKRRLAYRQDPARALLGDTAFEFDTLCDLWPSEDLGTSYHASVVSDIPTLIFHGTWDMSTPLENAREVAASLRNGRLVEVVGGNHGALYNLYERWPPMYTLMRQFLAGKPAEFPASVDDTAEIVFKTPSAL
jgi:pimeloyl-ACP methyl ester carboxylesterase